MGRQGGGGGGGVTANVRGMSPQQCFKFCITIGQLRQPFRRFVNLIRQKSLNTVDKLHAPFEENTEAKLSSADPSAQLGSAHRWTNYSRRKRARAHARTHTRARTHSRTHTHTHTRTHKHVRAHRCTPRARTRTLL